MILKVHCLTILLLMLAFVRLANAQSLTNSQNGTITVRVACNCQIITDKSNQPLHFMSYGKNQRDTKHLKIISNCTWNLRVVTNKRDNEKDECMDKDRERSQEYDRNTKVGNDKNDKWEQDNRLITYTFRNIRGKGSLFNPSEKYVLGSSPQNLPSGIGAIEFDVIFELERTDSKLAQWGEYNTWVSFYVLPKE